jgi:hypothetical protein
LAFRDAFRLRIGGDKSIRLGPARNEVLGSWGAGELLARQVRDEQHGAARPLVNDDVLGLAIPGHPQFFG